MYTTLTLDLTYLNICEERYSAALLETCFPNKHHFSPCSDLIYCHFCILRIFLAIAAIHKSINDVPSKGGRGGGLSKFKMFRDGGGGGVNFLVNKSFFLCVSHTHTVFCCLMLLFSVCGSYYFLLLHAA